MHKISAPERHCGIHLPLPLPQSTEKTIHAEDQKPRVLAKAKAKATAKATAKAKRNPKLEQHSQLLQQIILNVGGLLRIRIVDVDVHDVDAVLVDVPGVLGHAAYTPCRVSLKTIHDDDQEKKGRKEGRERKEGKTNVLMVFHPALDMLACWYLLC